MNPYIFVISLIGSYLIGSISFSRIVTKIVSPTTDLTKVSLKIPNQEVELPLKTVGATTASVVLGSKIGWVIALLDIAKGFLPTLAFRLLFPGTDYFLIFGLAVIVGHIWPIFFGFHGGGGLAATIGFLTAIDTLGVWVSAFVVIILGVFVFHETVITFLGGPWVFLIWIAIRTGNLWYILANLTANLLIIIASIPDIREGLKRGAKTEIATGMDALPIAQPIKKLAEFFKFNNKHKKPLTELKDKNMQKELPPLSKNQNDEP